MNRPASHAKLVGSTLSRGRRCGAVDCYSEQEEHEDELRAAYSLSRLYLVVACDQAYEDVGSCAPSWDVSLDHSHTLV